MAADQLLSKKVSFFNSLEALNDSSDEEDTNDIYDVIRQYTKPAASLQPVVQRIRTPAAVKIPSLQRAISAPASIVRETPYLPRQYSLFREEIAAPLTTLEVAVIEETPAAPTPTNVRPAERQTVSTPSIGTDLVLKYSTGIESMLRTQSKAPPKSQKRKKEQPIKLVLESERIFQGLNFYYVPPEDVGNLKKSRVLKARQHGAVWVKDKWTADVASRITHVIVDEDYADIRYEDVMEFLKIDSLPSHITMVVDQYPMDCIDPKNKRLVDPNQTCYEVRRRSAPRIQETIPIELQASARFLAIPKTRSKSIRVEETPPRSQKSTQQGQAEANPQLGVGASQAFLANADSSIVESPVEDSYFENVSNERQQYSFGAELDEMIRLGKSVQHLPMDDDEEDFVDSRPSSRDAPEETDSESEQPKRRKGKPMKKGTGGRFNQEGFTCMKGSDGKMSDHDPNKHMIEVLQQMCAYYTRIDDHWRMTAYRKVISMLKSLDYKVSTYDQAIELPTIGTRLAAKIEEIVLTGRLRRLENAEAEPADKYLETFLKIYDVGLPTAGKWVQQGYRTLADLLHKVKLTDNQRVGIDRYDDFATRIPRAEVTALGEIVKLTASRIDSSVEVTIGGSYRRGADDSGDIDCLLTKPGTSVSRDFLPFVNELVRTLTSSGFLVAALATPSEGGSASKWHGCCVLPGTPNPIWRRIDFLMVPETEFGAALIYFTGDDIFNRSLRLLASKKQMRLNQRGLYKDVMRGQERIKITEGTLMEGASEKKIFEILGVPFRPPEQRRCG